MTNYDPFGIQNIKTLLASKNLFLSKNRGQNYLINRHIAEKIIRQLPSLEENQTYFEVGTGLGALTVILAELGKTISLEIDKGIYHLVQENFCHPNLKHLHEDFLHYNLENNDSYIFVSNLPYCISGEVLKIFIENKCFNTGVLMLQKEFVNRMDAKPGTSEYGPLSVIAQTFLEIKPLFIVGRGNFFPEPKIDSLVVSIKKKNIALNQKEFHEFIKICFHAKRKTLENNLSRSIWKDSISLYNKYLKLRPDAISPEEWLHLFMLKNKSSYN